MSLVGATPAQAVKHTVELILQRSQIKPIALYFSVTALILGVLPISQALGQRHTAAIPPVQKQLKNWNWGTVSLRSKRKTDIRATDAWKIQPGSHRIVVAVVDTGIDPNHPDLKGNLWHHPVQKYRPMNPRLRNLKNPARPGLESIPRLVGHPSPNPLRSIYGWSYSRNQPNPIDTHGHGTHVAGIIGGRSNLKLGVSGVAKRVSIMPVKYYSASASGPVNLANSIKAFEYAIRNGAKIINYSGGGAQFSREEYLALKKAEDKGILVVAAAGNEKRNTDRSENYYFPAAYRFYGLKNIISVAAIDANNRLLDSSNWGKRSVDVVAPGKNIYSTIPGGKYGYMSGTSQATAFVSGIAALLLAENPSLTPAQVRSLIMKNVDPIGGMTTRVASGGKVNAFKSLYALKYGTQKGTRPVRKLARKSPVVKHTASLIR